VTVLLVAAGAAVGAPLRYLVDRALAALLRSVFPWGTLAVNVVGSFVLGVLAAGQRGSWLWPLVATGFCGALTTYSTLGYETVTLLRGGSWLLAALNAVGTAVLGVAALGLGLVVGGLVIGA